MRALLIYEIPCPTMNWDAPFALMSHEIHLPSGPKPGAVLVENGKIAGLCKENEVPSHFQKHSIRNHALLPGLVDTHAHINEPGRTEWEGFETATRAASAGGITTVIDMPLNSIPPTTTVAALETKRQAAAGKCAIDYGFWGGLVPGNAEQLAILVRAGVHGFKAFMIESGVEEFQFAQEKDLRKGMTILAGLKVPLLVHAELEGQAPRITTPPTRYDTYLKSRPRAWENQAIELIIRLVRETGCPTHIVHLSSSDAIDLLARAQKEGLPITAETCPHYLTIASEEIPARATEFKCAPPIREKENQLKLWEGLRSGVISLIVSDHSPCVPSLKKPKEGNYLEAWGGISSLQYGLPLIWTQARKLGFKLHDLTRFMCLNTAKFAGLDHRKGSIEVGKDADLVVFDREVQYKIREKHNHHRHHVTPYEGRAVQGQIKQVFLRGKEIYRSQSENQDFTETFSEEKLGQCLKEHS